MTWPWDNFLIASLSAWINQTRTFRTALHSHVYHIFSTMEHRLLEIRSKHDFYLWSQRRRPEIQEKTGITQVDHWSCYSLMLTFPNSTNEYKKPCDKWNTKRHMTEKVNKKVKKRDIKRKRGWWISVVEAKKCGLSLCFASKSKHVYYWENNIAILDQVQEHCQKV